MALQHRQGSDNTHGQQPQPARWVNDLRQLCELLRRTSPAEVTAVTCDFWLPEPGEVAAVHALSERLAEEYGLCRRVNYRLGWCDVQYYWNPDEELADAASAAPLEGRGDGRAWITATRHLRAGLACLDQTTRRLLGARLQR
jgi:hypothetical protein